MSVRILRTLLAGVFLSVAGAAYAEITSVNEAINKAGRQRMLSQRIAKAYLQLGQHVDESRARRVLDDSVAQFDRQLVELKHFAPAAEIRKTYLDLEREWLAVKDLLLGSQPSLDGGRRLLGLSESLLALTQQGTQQLERHSATEAGRLLNLAGRQRMLSQRMAVHYFAQHWGIAPERSAGELDQARREFAQALEELNRAAAGQSAAREELALAAQQWAFFETAVATSAGDARRRAQHVSSTSERLLESMERVAELFERPAGR